MAAELLVVLAAVGVAYGLYRFRRSSARSLFTFIRDARAVIGGVIGVVVAVVLIGSGYLPYMLIGGALVVYGTLYLLFEDPHERLLEVVG